MEGPLARLIAGLRAAADAGVIHRDEAARTLGEMLLDSIETSSSRQWQLQLSPALVDRVLASLKSGPTQQAGGEYRTATGLDRVLARIESVLGDPAGWPEPTTYESLALAVVDSVWSIGVRYAGVLNVVARYRRLRAETGADADRDTPEDLIAVIDRSGGAAGFADAVQNRQRTSSRNGILKAEAVLRAATVLRNTRIATPDQMRSARLEDVEALRRGWREVPGQGSGLSLDYFFMLCGMPGVKGDRMIRRFIATALGQENELTVDPATAVELVQGAARHLDVTDRLLDFAIWQHESGQTSRA